MASNDKLIRIILKLDDKFSSGMAKAGSNLDRVGSKMKSVGASMTRNITLPLLAVGAASVKMAMDLDKSMRNIQSISKQTDEEIAALSKTFVQMSTNAELTIDSANNLAEGFYDIQGSGFAGADAMKVLEASTMAATAGLTKTSTAAQGITAVLNSYGKSADEAKNVSDLMFRTVDRGVGTFEQLASSVSNVSGMAAVLDVDFKELSAAFSTMSKQGFTFSQASVSMNMAMTNLLKPTAAMKGAIADAGFASGSAMVKTLGFAGTIRALNDQVDGSPDKLAKMFSNIRGLRAVLALTGDQAGAFSEDLAAMNEAGGATAAAFAEQAKSFSFQFANFKNNLSAVAITIGQIILPVLNDFLQALLPLLQAFNAMPLPMQKMIVGFLALLAAMGPILTIVGTLMTSWSTFTTIIGAVSLPVAALVIALGALFVAIYKFRQEPNISQQKKNWGMFVEIIKLSVEKAGSFLWGLIKDMGTLGKNIVVALIKGIAIMIPGLGKAVLDVGRAIINGIKSVLQISSPSKVMFSMGQQTGAGFRMGVENELVRTLDSYTRTVQAMASSRATGSGASRTLGSLMGKSTRLAGQGARASQASGRAASSASSMTGFHKEGNRWVPNAVGNNQVTSGQTREGFHKEGNRWVPNAVGGTASIGNGFSREGNRVVPNAVGPGVNIGTMNISVPPGTTRQQSRAISEQIAKEAMKLGARSR